MQTRISEDYLPEQKQIQDNKFPAEPSFDKHLVGIKHWSNSYNFSEFIFSDGSIASIKHTLCE